MKHYVVQALIIGSLLFNNNIAITKKPVFRLDNRSASKVEYNDNFNILMDDVKERQQEIKIQQERKRVQEQKQREEQMKKEKEKQKEVKKKDDIAINKVSNNSSRTKKINIIATHYGVSASENGGFTALTASGKQLKYGMVATPVNIPFGSLIFIDGLGTFVAEDRGNPSYINWINENTVRIDIFVPVSTRELQKLGVKKYTGYIQYKTK